MLNRNGQFYEWLLPYLEGGLDEARRAQIEARLAADPALAAEAERLRRTLAGLRGAAARTSPPSSATVPPDLWPHLRARLVLEPAPPPRAPRAWWVAGLGAPAVAALIVAALWLPVWHTPDMAPLSHTSPPRPKAAPPSPAPSAVPAHPALSVPGPAAATGAAKQKAAASKPLPPAPIVTRADPFALRSSTPPANHSVNGSLAPPGVSTPPGSPVVRAPHAPMPVASIAPPVHQNGAGATSAAAPPMPAAPPPPTLTPAAPKLTPTPPAPTATMNDQNGNHPAASDPAASDEATATAGVGGGRFAPGSVSRENLNAAGSAASPQARSQQRAKPPTPAPQSPARRRVAPLRATDRALQAFAVNALAGLDSWQAALSGAVQPPLWGENAGEQQANQALMAAREAGMLDDLRARLEARRTQAPQDVVTGRMLAAVYDFGFSGEPALRERRRVAGLEGAGGEDWFALAQAEERAGNGSAARAAYRRALESPIPPSAFHAAKARGRS